MAIDFPASPNANQTFTVGSITYKWDGVKWIGLGVTPADRLVEGSNSLEITAGNDLVWTGDNVGIKTTDPQSALEVVDNISFTSGDTMPQLRIKATSGAIGKVMNLGLNETDDYGLIQTMDRGTGYSTALILQPYGTARVGIGAGFSDPDAKLEVRDSAATGVIIRCTNTQTTDSNKALRIRNNSSTDTFSISHKGFITVSGADGTSADTALFQNTTSGGNNRVRINCLANGGGDPYIKFDAGGSNMIVGEYYNGTTNNKLVLGVGETPSAVAGLSIDGNGNGIYGNGHQSTALAVDSDSNRGLNFSTGGRIYCKTNNHWDFNLVGGGLMMRFRNGNDNGGGATQTVVGNITINASSVDFNTTQSDSRLKKNIESWSDGVLQHFKTLQPKKFHFNWQSDEESLETGYIAQDLVDAFPEAYPLCKTEIDGEEVDRYSFNPSGMVKYLMKALQEEIVKREALEARLEAAGF
jgi:hypothetical protein